MKRATLRVPCFRRSKAMVPMALAIGLTATLTAPTWAQANPDVRTIESKTVKARPLPLEAVRLTGGPLKAAQDADAKFLLTMEPVFAWLISFFFLHERFNQRSLVGAALILTGILITELLPTPAPTPAHPS